MSSRYQLKLKSRNDVQGLFVRRVASGVWCERTQDLLILIDECSTTIREAVPQLQLCTPFSPAAIWTICDDAPRVSRIGAIFGCDVDAALGESAFRFDHCGGSEYRGEQFEEHDDRGKLVSE